MAATRWPDAEPDSWQGRGGRGGGNERESRPRDAPEYIPGASSQPGKALNRERKSAKWNIIFPRVKVRIYYISFSLCHGNLKEGRGRV